MTNRRSAAPIVVVVIAAALAGACQSAAAARPAVLTSADQATMDQLTSQLAKAMGRAHVELGPGDPTQSSRLSVLPPRPGALEDRSLAKPTIFIMEIEAKTCTLVRQDTGERISLEGIDCRAVTP